MTYMEIVQQLAERLNRTQTDIKNLLQISTKTLVDISDQDQDVPIPRFGTFGTHLRQERKSFNPREKVFMMLPKKRILRFRPGQTMKEGTTKQRFES